MGAPRKAPVVPIESLRRARELARLGARPQTIAYLTRLSTVQIRRTVYDDQFPVPKGPPRYAHDRYFRVGHRCQAEYSAFAGKTLHLLDAGLAFSDAVLSAYTSHLRAHAQPSLAFDDAFFLACQLTGMLAVEQPVLHLCRCPSCGSHHLRAIGEAVTSECPICRLSRKARRGDDLSPSMARNARAQREALTLQEVAQKQDLQASVDQHVHTLSLRDTLIGFGATARVVCAVLSSLPCPKYIFAKTPSAPVVTGTSLNQRSFSERVSPLRRAQLSCAAATFERLVQGGTEPAQALAASYQHLTEICRDDPERVPFDKVFEAVSFLTASWGVAEPTFSLVPCAECGTRFLTSTLEASTPRCPICELRNPGAFDRRRRRSRASGPSTRPHCVGK